MNQNVLLSYWLLDFIINVYANQDCKAFIVFQALDQGLSSVVLRGCVTWKQLKDNTQLFYIIVYFEWFNSNLSCNH